jgi:hypothetical protein
MSQEVVYNTPGVGEARRAYYRRLAEEPALRETVQEFVIPRETGKAFPVDAGQILRVAQVDGPQVADFNAFSREDPREMFWSARTRILEGVHLTVGNRLWSTPPRMRPMFTIIADTVDHRPLPHRAASHDLLYARCNERLFEVVAGQPGRRNCQDNLAAAIKEFGLGPEHVHDAFNLFMTTGIDDNGRLFYLDPDAKKGEYVELHAEMDCLVAISACPGGCSGPHNKPIGVQVYRHSLKR